MDLDDIVFIPVTSGQELFDTDALFEIIASTPRAEDVDRAITQIKDILIKRHAHKEDFTIQTQGALLETMNTILNVLTAVLGGIAGISLVVGGIGIMNIMLVSVRERTREIGVRMAVGARRFDILLQFLFEAIVVSLAGGIVGIGLGYFAAAVLASFGGWATVVPMYGVVLALAVSIVIGVAFGVGPARRAAGLDPVEALRFD
jgi:putative ABC transport system permease protein